jgi:hypothetical protein
LGFGAEGGVIGDTAFFPALPLFNAEPALRKEEAAIEEGVAGGGGVGDEDAGLTIVDFAEVTAVLASDADGFRALLWDIAPVDAEDALRIAEEPGGLFFVAAGEQRFVPAHGADELLEVSDTGLPEGSQSDGFHGFAIESTEEALEISGAERFVLHATPAIMKEAVEGFEFPGHRVHVFGGDIHGGRCSCSKKDGHGFSSRGRERNPAVGEGRKVGAMDAEALSKLWGQGIEEHLLGMAVKAEGSSVFGEAAGGTNGYPVGGFVAGAGETLGVNKRFQQGERVAVAKNPVSGNTSRNESENMGSEMRHTHPGENQETGVVRDEREVLLPKSGGPADGAVAGLQFPHGRPPSESGQHTSVSGVDKVFDSLSHEGAEL